MPTTHRYVPANTAADLPPGSRFQAMDAFLLSDQVADPVMAAARDIAADAAELAGREASKTGTFAGSFGVQESPVPLGGGLSAHEDDIPRLLPGGPRRAAEVYNDAPHAATVEFGNDRGREGKRILHRAGQRYDEPKASTWP